MSIASHHRVPVKVELDSFEGPLDLLLYLIQSHEMNVSRISLQKLTDQYLTYVRLMEELNFDIASEFLVMAATLLFWKSKAILPKDEEELGANQEEDNLPTQEDLIRQLLEHKRFLEAGQTLAGRPLLHLEVFARPNRKPPIERVWREMNVTDLSLSFQDLLTRARKRNRVLRKETVSIAEKMQEFADRLEPGKITEMAKLLSIHPSRVEVVVTFLASLELSRMKKMRVHQEGTYQSIYLELLEKFNSLALNFRSEFDREEKNPETEGEKPGEAASTAEAAASDPEPGTPAPVAAIDGEQPGTAEGTH